MKKYKMYIIFMLLAFTCLFFSGCTDKGEENPIEYFRIEKNVFDEGDEIVIEVGEYKKGYYLGFFGMTSEPGKSGGYKKKTLSDDQNTYVFKTSDLRGPGEYQLFLYRKNTNVVLKREVIKINSSDKSDYQVSAATFVGNSSDGVFNSKIIVTPSKLADGTNELTYRFYWAKDNKRLDDYTAIKVFETSSTEQFEVTFNECMYAPSEANEIEVEVFEGVSTSYFTSIDNNTKLSQSNYQFNFQVVSDVHLDSDYTFTEHTNHLTSLMKDISLLQDKSKGLFIVGDLTNSGKIPSYDFFKKTITSLNEKAAIDIYYSVGNHECHNYDDYSLSKENFLNFTGRDSIYCSYEINNMKFILLGQEDITVHGQMSQAQIDWFEEEISKTDRNTPTFVFMHQPLKDTVTGAFAGQGNSGMSMADSQIKNIIKNYPNVFMFSGHSHKTPDLEKTANFGHGSNATFINTGSLGYLLGLNSEEVGGSSGLFIEVYDDYILVKARDFVSGKWYGSSQYVFPITK